MTPLVLHCLPIDIARGAQRYARALRLHLTDERVRHETVTFYRSNERALEPDHRLDLPRDVASRVGFDPRVVVSLGRLIQRLHPALVVAHGSEPLKYLAVSPSSPPIVYYKIGITHALARGGARRALHSFLLSRAARVAGVSRECLEEAEACFGVPSRKLALIPNGRDPEVFRPRTGPANPVPELVFLGHLTSSKRPARFLELVARLRARGVSFSAKVLGDGPLRESLVAQAARAGVTLFGHCDDVAAHLREADVLAFTSLPEGEGMPGVFIEAGLSGLPVVTTDVPGARTVVADESTGYVVDVNDLDALVARTERLLVDPSLRERMARAARSRCAAEFTLERSMELWRALFSELLAAEASPRRGGGR